MKSVIYKVGIIYDNNKSLFISKSLWHSAVIKDISKLRFYIFGIDESYEKIKSDTVENEIILSQI